MSDHIEPADVSGRRRGPRRSGARRSGTDHWPTIAMIAFLALVALIAGVRVAARMT